MNLKKLFLMLTFLVLLGTTAFAQTTYYVNNSTGLDGYNGLSATVTGDPGVGPKLTIANAIAAAVDGDVISIAYTGVAYGVVNTSGKALTFTSSGGTPVVGAITIDAATIFTGAINMGSGTLTLTSGAVTGAGNLTLASGTTILRTAGTLDVAPVFTTTVNLNYTGAVTIGPEFPTSATVTSALTVTGAITVTVNRSIQTKGVLTVPAGATLALGGNTLTMTAGSSALSHPIAGTISTTTGGGMTLTTSTGSHTFTGAGTLPGLTISSTSTGSVTVNGPTSIAGSVTVNSGPVTLTTPTGASGVTGSIINNGTGLLTVTASLTVGGNVSNTSSGVIAFGNAVRVNGNVSNSGVQNNTSNTAQVSGAGNITFAAAIVTVDGTVTNSASFSGTSSGIGAATGGFTNCGNITFASTTQLVTLTGLVTNNTSSSFTATAAADAGLFSGNGNITFASTTGNVVLTGGLTNSSSGFANYGVTPTAPTVGNGSVFFTARTTGTIAVGNVTNSSTATGGTTGSLTLMSVASGDIEFGFLNDSDGAITVTGNVSLEGGSGTGDINFGGGALTVTGSVSNSRSSTSAIIRQRGLLTGTSNVSVGSLSQTGTGQIQFAGTTATLTTTVAGASGITISAGTISSNSTTGAITINGPFNQIGGAFTVAASTTGTITITGNFSLSAGTFNHGGTGNTTGNLSVNGNLSFTGGTLVLGTGTRNFTVTGATSTISAGVAFTGGANTTLVFNRAISAQTLTSGIGVQWPGNLNVNNTFPAAPTWNLSGANFGVTGNAIFTAGGGANGVNLNNFTLFVGGNFTNNSGYTGGANGFVSLNGGGAQTVSGSAAFYNIEVDKAAGVATFGTGAALVYTITGTFNLTNSAVAVGAGDAIAFNNATTAPTIVRNAGSFVAAPTFTSDVNVVYIGASKTFSNEVPLGGSNKLVNMTIATTGASTVTANIDFEFKGTLTINTGQTFAIGTQVVTSNGAAINVNGTGTWTSTTGYINLNRAAGTVVTTTGALPEVRIAFPSIGNTLSGTGISIGTNPDLTLGGGSSAVTLTFTGAGPHVRTITTADASNTITLGSNVVASGALVHANGTINLGAYNLSVAGSPSSMSTTAAITGTGALIFNKTGAQVFNIGAGGATIASNVQMNMDLAATTLTIAGNPLTITGNLTLTKGALTPTGGLNVNGSALNLTANASVAGAGVLTFAPTGTLTVTLAGATTFDNLTVNGNVTLAGATGALTITNTLTHTSGLINFANRDLIVGTLTRTAGTYSAGTGYLQVNTAFTQGTGFSIPNLRINNSMGIGTAAGFTVTDNLYLANAVVFNHTSGTARLTLGVASGNVPTVTVVGTGDLNVAPLSFGQGTCNYVFTGGVATSVASTTKYWPATASLANNVTVNQSAGGVTIDDSRTINGNLNLTSQVLDIADAQTLTLATSGATITRSDFGTITLTGTGALSAANVNLAYTPTVANAVAAVTAGVEYTSPTVINNVTVNPKITLTIGDARTIAGDLVANFAVTFTASTTVTGSLTGSGTITVTTPAVLTVNGSNITIAGTLAGTGSANFSGNVTLGALTNTGTLGFVGATGQTVTVPTGGATLTNMNVNMTGLNPVLRISGGGITIANAGTLTFTNGIVDMTNNGTEDNVLVLARPTNATNSGLGFSRVAVTGTKVGHVVGKISRAGNAGDGASGTNGRFEFPTGTLSGQYRPAAITFTPNYVLGNPVSIIVSHVDASPQGTVGLPLDGGNGVTVGNYPAFYWLTSTTPSSVTSTQNFDMDLQANNIGIPYTSDALLRMIRRQDGSATSNAWSMQGTAANYSNYQVVNGTDTTIVVRTVSAQGGLVLQGSRFTLGVPARAPNFTAPVAATATVAEGATATIQFTAVPLNTNDGTVTYSKTSGPTWAALNTTTGLVTLTPGYSDYSATPYTLVIRATTTSNLVTEKTVTITVTNSDQGPVLATATATVNPATATTGNGVAKTLTYTATDADGDVVTYSYTVDKAVSTGSVVFSTTAGTLTFTPAYADIANSPFTFTVTASSGTPALTAVVNTVFTVTNSGLLGDVNLSGSVTAADAVLVLNYVVNPTTYPLTAQQMWAADVNNDGSIGAYDAASILVKAGGGNFLAKQIAAAGTASFSQFTSDKGSYTLPISLVNTAGVKSFYAEVQLGNNLEFNGVTSRLPEGWMMASNIENGTLKIAMAGTTPLTDGSVALINLSLKDKDAKVNVQGSVTLNDQISGAMNAVQIREIPTEFSVSQNYPNPFNPTTNIKYGIPQNARVTLTVYNILGQAVRTLVNADQEAGNYTVIWNGKNDFGGQVSSGVYIYRISAGNFTHSVKMNLLK